MGRYRVEGIAIVIRDFLDEMNGDCWVGRHRYSLDHRLVLRRDHEQHERVFVCSRIEMNGGDLKNFYTAAERLSKEPISARHQNLTVLAGP